VDATVEKIRQNTVWKEGEVQIVYGNVVGVGSTPYDVNFLIGQIDGATADQVNARPLLKVILSPELAANLATLLNVVMEAYVAGNGPLRTTTVSSPEELKRRMLESAIKIER
jgi:hypothetical protein